MSTRGIFGVRIDGVDKLIYNHCDSYPSWLGAQMFIDTQAMLKDWGIDEMIARARALKMVNRDIPPTDEDITHLSGFANLGVATQSSDDWYCLLRKLQGNIMDVLVVGYAEDSGDFILDSLFCEWAYIINFDERVLEVYQGFQDAPHTKGRYADKFAELGYDRTVGDYYPCALLASFPLDSLPETENDFLIAVNLAPFDTVEDALLNRMKEYGDITAEDAASLFGIEHIGEVVESIEKAGHIVNFDGENYSL